MRLTALESETSPGGRLPGIWGGGVALKCCAGLTRPPRSSQTRPTPAPERARPFWACTGPKPRRERLKWKQAGSRAPLVAGTGPAQGGCSPCVREVARDASRGVAVGARLPRESWAGTFPRVDLDSGPLVLPLLEFQFSSVQSLSRVRLCDPTDRSMPGLPERGQLPEFTQTPVHRVSDAIQPSHPLSSPSPPTLTLSQHQGVFQ